MLFLLGIGVLSVRTLVIAVRGGRGPGAPPASLPHVDPNGFPVLAPPQRHQRPGLRRSGRFRPHRADPRPVARP